MKIGYEQIVENMQTRAGTHSKGISLPLFGYLVGFNGKKSVKQR